MTHNGRLFAILAGLVPVAGGCNAILGIDSHPQAANGSDAAAGSGQTDGGGTGGVGAAVGTACGFKMPNPASIAELPNHASYTPNPDGTITDDVTGLIWEARVGPTQEDQAKSIDVCAAKGNGFRLPTRIELTSLVDFTVVAPGPTINAIFQDTPPVRLWTSSRGASDQKVGWTVVFGLAGPFSAGSTHQTENAGLDRSFKVRCVRGGLFNCPSPRFLVQADGSVPGGSVLDTATGLTWQRTISPTAQAWTFAKTFCPPLGPDFRLPSLTELQTIVDETKEASNGVGAAIDLDVFPGTPGAAFWTSSVQADAPSARAWFVTFLHGHSEVDGIDKEHFVRCVRSE